MEPPQEPLHATTQLAEPLLTCHQAANYSRSSRLGSTTPFAFGGSRVSASAATSACFAPTLSASSRNNGSSTRARPSG